MVLSNEEATRIFNQSNLSLNRLEGPVDERMEKEFGDFVDKEGNFPDYLLVGEEGILGGKLKGLKNQDLKYSGISIKYIKGAKGVMAVKLEKGRFRTHRSPLSSTEGMIL